MSEKQTSAMDDMFPEPLFESFLLSEKKVCLACGKYRAASVLYTSINMRPLIPLCVNCAADWNFYGYLILKRIKPKKLLTNLVFWKLLHPFQSPSILSIIRDLRGIAAWSKRMTKWTKDNNR
jgi:hypothetical protein